MLSFYLYLVLFVFFVSFFFCFFLVWVFDMFLMGGRLQGEINFRRTRLFSGGRLPQAVFIRCTYMRVSNPVSNGGCQIYTCSFRVEQFKYIYLIFTQIIDYSIVLYDFETKISIIVYLHYRSYANENKTVAKPLRFRGFSLLVFTLLVCFYVL